MKRLIIIIVPALLALMISCARAGKTDGDPLVVIKTEYGDITVKLYGETPEHKANLLKLVDEGFYNGLLFHRVIQNFMIQGGDPDSKNAQPGQQLGGGSLDYTLPAEFVPSLYHKRGALAAARKGDAMNPEKRSSASQFYIVQGEVYTDAKLDTMEMMKNARKKQEILQKELSAHAGQLKRYQANSQRDSFEVLYVKARETADSIYEAADKFKFSESQRNDYKTIGGYPSLDGDYTVFGEVVGGIEVVDKIAAVEKDKNNRPLKDIKMEVERVK